MTSPSEPHKFCMGRNLMVAKRSGERRINSYKQLSRLRRSIIHHVDFIKGWTRNSGTILIPHESSSCDLVAASWIRRVVYEEVPITHFVACCRRSCVAHCGTPQSWKHAHILLKSFIKLWKSCSSSLLNTARLGERTRFRRVDFREGEKSV